MTPMSVRANHQMEEEKPKIQIDSSLRTSVALFSLVNFCGSSSRGKVDDVMNTYRVVGGVLVG